MAWFIFLEWQFNFCGSTIFDSQNGYRMALKVSHLWISFFLLFLYNWSNVYGYGCSEMVKKEWRHTFIKTVLFERKQKKNSFKFTKSLDCVDNLSLFAFDETGYATLKQLTDWVIGSFYLNLQHVYISLNCIYSTAVCRFEGRVGCQSIFVSAGEKTLFSRCFQIVHSFEIHEKSLTHSMLFTYLITIPSLPLFCTWNVNDLFWIPYAIFPDPSKNYVIQSEGHLLLSLCCGIVNIL